MIYQVLCDDALIFDSRLNENELQLYDASVELELNKAGSFSFTIYPTHPDFGALKKLKSIVTVYQDGILIFRGRILNDETGFYGEKTVTCEGELAFLVDSIQRPYSFPIDGAHATPADLFTFLINRHNQQVDDAHKFNVGTITVTDPNNYVARSDTTYQNTWDAINTKLIEGYGGYLNVRHESNGNYIDYLADFSETNQQSIEFGANLLDISQIIRGEDIYTVLIPVGAKINEETEERLNITSLPDGDLGDGITKSGDTVYSQDAIDRYGRIVRMETWDDVTIAENLRTKGKARLLEGINPVLSIEVTAADLAGIDADISSFHVGKYVIVNSRPHGLLDTYLVQKLTISLTDPSSNKLTVGKTYLSYTEQQNNSLSGVAEKINTVNADAKAIRTDIANNYYSKTDINGMVYTKTQTDDLLNNKSNVGHNHDDRYYTESEVNNLLNAYLPLSAGNGNPLTGDFYMKNGSINIPVIRVYSDGTMRYGKSDIPAIFDQELRMNGEIHSASGFKVTDVRNGTTYQSTKGSSVGSGYVTLPWGLILMWGYSTGVVSSGAVDVNPAIYCKTILCAVANPVSSAFPYVISPAVFSENKIRFQISNPGGTIPTECPFRWMAIGY